MRTLAAGFAALCFTAYAVLDLAGHGSHGAFVVLMAAGIAAVAVLELAPPRRDSAPPPRDP